MLYSTLVKKVSVRAELKTKQKDYLETGRLPIIDQGKNLVGGFTNDANKVIDCELPVIVFGDHTKVVKHITFPFGAGADGIKVLKAKELVSSKYLYYGTQYLTYKIEDKGYARHYQFLEKSDLPLPPLPEQQCIVEKIEELFSEVERAVADLNKTKVQLKIYRQAVLKQAFDEIGNNKPITDFFNITGGLTKNSKRSEFATQMPYLRVANVYYNKLDLSIIKMIGVQIQEIERTKLECDDLLFVEGNGSKEQIGRVAVWGNEIKNCLHQNHIIKARPNSQMLSLYALYYFMSIDGRKQILDVASSTSGLYTLSLNKIKNLHVPFCKFKKQEYIVQEIESRLSVCDKIEQTVNESLLKAESLRQSILKQAFEGKLV